MGVVVSILYESYVEFLLCFLADCRQVLMAIILQTLTGTLKHVQGYFCPSTINRGIRNTGG
jgi:hypothetical protein